MRRAHVVIAPARQARPHHFAHVAEPAVSDVRCPFCPGNEGDTTLEVHALRPPASAPDAPGWELRVVANRYPVLEPGPEQEEAGWDAEPPHDPDALFSTRPALGHHEVVIESPAHAITAADHPLDTLTEVVRAYRDRARALQAAGYSHVLVFRNQRAPAGASLLHPHTQITATRHASLGLLRVHDAERRHRERTGRCLVCDLLPAERAAGRLIDEEGGYVCVAPFASRFAYEVWLAAESHPVPFAALSDQDVLTFARLLHRVLARQKACLGDAPQNWVLHAAPGPVPGIGDHWRLEILPRLARIGGFELGAGIYVNIVAPEQVVGEMRGAGADPA